VSAVSDAALVRMGYLVRATRLTGSSSARFGCEEAYPISARPALAVLAAMAFDRKPFVRPHFFLENKCLTFWPTLHLVHLRT
jgi:hypothetical protein